MTKPLHGEFKRLRRCPCCQTKYSKKNSGGKNDGKSSARRRAAMAAEREAALKEPCYAPDFWCMTHNCSIDKCWEEKRCDALYALNLPR